MLNQFIRSLCNKNKYYFGYNQRCFSQQRRYISIYFCIRYLPLLLLLMYLNVDGLFFGVQKSDVSIAAESLAMILGGACSLEEDSGLLEYEFGTNLYTKLILYKV